MRPVSRTVTLPFFILVVALAGCGGSSPSTTRDPDPPTAGLLKSVTSAAELEAAIKGSLTTLPPGSGPEDVLAVSGTPSAGGGNFTGTYTQEANVDEFDVVRYDGAHLYVAPRRFMGCCYILAADGGMVAGGTPADSIRILATDPANAGATVVSTIPLISPSGTSPISFWAHCCTKPAITATQGHT